MINDYATFKETYNNSIHISLDEIHCKELIQTLTLLQNKNVFFETSNLTLNKTKCRILKNIVRNTKSNYYFLILLDDIFNENIELYKDISNIAENFEVVIKFIINRSNVSKIKSVPSFFKEKIPLANILLEYDKNDFDFLKEILNDQEEKLSFLFIPKKSKNVDITRISDSCGRLHDMTLTLNCDCKSVNIQSCCFLKGKTISFDEFIKTPFNTLSNYRYNNEGEIDCKFNCNLKKVTNLYLCFFRCCNIHCYNCCAGKFNNIKDATSIMEKVFNKVLLEKNNYKRLYLDGSGEIFLIYDVLVDFLKKLSKDYCEEIIFASNATLLDEIKLKELKEISSKTNIKYSFDISLDGITKETYENTRRGATFEKVLNNIKNVSKLFEFDISFTAKKTNVSDNPYEVLDFFKELKPRAAFIRYDIFDDNIKKKYLEEYRDLLSV